MRKIAVFVILSFLVFAKFPQKTLAASDLKCEWSSPDDGSLFFCVGGFTSVEEAKEHHYRFKCTDNCSSSGLRGWWYDLFGGDTATINDANVAADPKNPGTYYSCVQMIGGFTKDIDEAIDRCMRPGIAEKAAAAGCGQNSPGEIAVSLNPIGAIINAVNTLDCSLEANASDIYNKTFEECIPEFTGYVKPNDLQVSCQAILPISLSIEGLTGFANTPFELCSQINASDKEAIGECEQCIKNDDNPQGVWTAIGCIPTEPTGIIQTLITLGLSLGGGITLLLILAGAFRLSVSAGDPKQAEEAREQITSAVIGLLFIIFSVVMLRFIGIQVLQIPGFGG